MMRAVLKLEYIAENYHAGLREAAKRQSETPRSVSRYGDMLGRDKSRPWVARLTGLDEQYGFSRAFVCGQIDYSRANSVGSRGVYLYFALTDGVYEVNERTSWTKVRRYFILVDDTEIIEVERKDVEQWLQQPTSAD